VESDEKRGGQYMNYEDFYSEVSACEKEISGVMKVQSKHYKSLCKNLSKGDLKNAVKDQAQVGALSKDFEDCFSKLRGVVENFDGREYMQSGEFTTQMLEFCQKTGVDAVGEGAVFEMFPYKVRLDFENLDAYVDRKKVQCFRPQYLINEIKAGQDKLLKAPFNADVFADELADAYDLALLKQSKNKAYAPDSSCSLLNLYKYLTPMRRFRKEYDKQNYAFDLARLHSSGLEYINDGRKFQFGPGRDISKSIRILDADGNEQFLSTIRFYS